jgi:hypothetical protein
VLNNDRKVGLIEENAHGLQYAPGSTRMLATSSANPFEPSRRADNIEFCDCDFPTLQIRVHEFPPSIESAAIIRAILPLLATPTFNRYADAETTWSWRSSNRSTEVESWRP